MILNPGSAGPTLRCCINTPSLHISLIHNRPDLEALQQAAPGNVLGQLLDRHPGHDAPDVGLARHLCRSASKRGSDSLLMKFGCLLVLVS